jgi:hypothetical protein
MRVLIKRLNGITFRFTTKNHALYYFAACKTPTHDLHHTNIVDVEILWVLGHDDKGSLGNQ